MKGQVAVLLVIVRGLLARKLRLALTAFAILLGVSMISGTFVLTDKMNAAFSDIFKAGNKNVDVAIWKMPDPPRHRQGQHQHFLCDYTQEFALEHLSESKCDTFSVSRARFNYDTRTWATERYYLPRVRDDFILLTPSDILTRDETWINHSDMVSKFSRLPLAVSDTELRAQINQYFARVLGRNPTADERSLLGWRTRHVRSRLS